MKRFFTLSKYPIFFLVVICLTWVGVFSFAQKYENECLFENFDLVSDAVSGIQETLDQQDIKPYFVKRIYEISKDEVNVTTKSHYSQYRKKPTYTKQVFKTDTVNPHEIDIKVEFVYKSSDKNHLTQINKKSKRSKPNFKKIAFKTDGNSLLKA